MAKGKVQKSQQQPDDLQTFAEKLKKKTLEQAEKVIDDVNIPIEKKLSLIQKLSSGKLTEGTKIDPNKAPDVLLAHERNEPLRVCSHCNSVVE